MSPHAEAATATRIAVATRSPAHRIGRRIGRLADVELRRASACQRIGLVEDVVAEDAEFPALVLRADGEIRQ